jgi:hypothetical protein
MEIRVMNHSTDALAYGLKLPLKNWRIYYFSQFGDFPPEKLLAGFNAFFGSNKRTIIGDTTTEYSWTDDKGRCLHMRQRFINGRSWKPIEITVRSNRVDLIKLVEAWGGMLRHAD